MFQAGAGAARRHAQISGGSCNIGRMPSAGIFHPQKSPRLASTGELKVGAIISLVIGDEIIRVKATSESQLLLLYQISFVEYRYSLVIEAMTEPFRERFTLIRFLCPGCGVRSRHLYFRGWFACTKCQNLNILSGERVMQMRKQLKAGETPVDEITRPAGLHRERFDWRITLQRELEPVVADDARRYAKRLGVLEWIQR